MGAAPRNKIIVKDGKLLLNSAPVRVVFRKKWVSVGCTDISRDAIDLIWKAHEDWLASDHHVFQD